METPPPTRRRLVKEIEQTAFDGNTSAYAEKTITKEFPANSLKKHLRLRGEDTLIACSTSPSVETPPPTRRRPLTLGAPLV